MKLMSYHSLQAFKENLSSILQTIKLFDKILDNTVKQYKIKFIVSFYNQHCYDIGLKTIKKDNEITKIVKQLQENFVITENIPYMDSCATKHVKFEICNF